MNPGKNSPGIKKQILMVTLIPNTILILLLAIYLVGARVEDLDREFHAQGDAISRQVATAAIPSLFAHNYGNLQLLAQETIDLHPQVLSVQIIDQFNRPLIVAGENDTNILAGTDVAYFEVPIQPAQTTFELYRYSLDQPIQVDPDKPLQLGIVHIYLDSTGNTAEQQKIIRNSAILSAFGLLFSAFLSIFLSTRIAEPVERITRAMKRLRKGDRNVSVDLNARGEIGELQLGFNDMAREIATANDNMLMQVDQATHDLQASMEVLEIKNVELDLARKRALTASRFKSEFLANMSHEIRTPMNGILGFTNLMDKTELNGLQQEYLKTIKASSANLLTIINDILDLSKLEAGKLTLESRPFSLRECMENAISLLAPLAHEIKLELISIVYNDVPDRLIGDQTRITQIITNLVNNAIKFTSEGEVILRAMLDDEDSNTVQITLNVSDTGIGIPPEEQKTIFSAFSQGTNISKSDNAGTGLGLSICKRLASAMGGDISVTSTHGEGSSFDVTLRLNKNINYKVRATSGLPFSGKKVLLVDANHISRMVIRNDLSGLGFQVIDVDKYELDHQQKSKLYDALVMCMDANAIHSRSQLRLVGDTIQAFPGPTILLASSSSQKMLDTLKNTGAMIVRSKPIKRSVLKGSFDLLYPSADDDGSRLDELTDNQSDIDTNWLRGTRILIADDNKINRQLIESLLSRFGVEVLTARNGQEAVDQVTSTDVDLVLMDIHMPVMDGFEATTEIRRNVGDRLPVVALTADAMEKNRHDIKRHGFNGYLIKPLDELKLHQLLVSLLQTKPLGEVIPTDIEIPVQANTPLPVRDTKKALSIAGGSEAIAQKLLEALCDTLDQDYSELLTSYDTNDWETMWQALHKLQGSTAVCAVPALHQSVLELQPVVKMEDSKMIRTQLDLLKIEINKLKDFNQRQE